MNVIRLTPRQFHAAATRAALLRRHVFPGNEAWKDFFPKSKRDWCDVSHEDVKAILDRPHKYVPTYGASLIDVLGRERRFRHPSRPFGVGLVHHSTAVTEAYGTVVSGNGGITSLGTSSTWVAGYEWYTVDHTASNPTGSCFDWFHQDVVQVGTTPSTATEIRAYLVGSADGTTWPDVFAGSAAARTLTSAGVGAGFLKLGAVGACDSATSNRNYPLAFGTRATFGGSLPKKFSVFITHNTGVNLNATAGNHTYLATPEYVNFG